MSQVPRVLLVWLGPPAQDHPAPPVYPAQTEARGLPVATAPPVQPDPPAYPAQRDFPDRPEPRDSPAPTVAPDLSVPPELPAPRDPLGRPQADPDFSGRLVLRDRPEPPETLGRAARQGRWGQRGPLVSPGRLERMVKWGRQGPRAALGLLGLQVLLAAWGPQGPRDRKVRLGPLDRLVRLGLPVCRATPARLLTARLGRARRGRLV
jgi:hypothetical protein